MIVGVTGPVVFFTQTVHMLADTIDAPFLQLMGWISIWSGLMHIVVAASGATVLVQKVTNFRYVATAQPPMNCMLWQR